MSLATRQSMFMLSITCAALREMIKNNDVPEVLAPTVYWAEECSCRMVNNYPHAGDLKKYDAWRISKIEEWKNMGDPEGKWEPLVLLGAGLHFCENMLETIRNKQVLADLEALREAINRIWVYQDDREVNADKLENEANQVADELYQVIGFSR